MKNNILIIVLVVSLVMNLTFVAMVAFRHFSPPAPPPPPPGMEEGPPMGPGMKHPTFSPEKLAEFKKLQEEFKAERLEARDTIKDLRKQLFDEVRKDEPDMDKIFSLIDAIGQEQNKIQKSVVKKVIEQRQSLPPEERPAFDGLIKKKLLKKHGKGPGGKGWWKKGGHPVEPGPGFDEGE
jgi:Spy/CpxP family protein refolding chaperone